MLKIVSEGEGRNFSCILHYAIHDGVRLYGASFVGFPSAAWAVNASLVTGRKVAIETPDGVLELHPDKFRHMERRVGRLVHQLLMPRSGLLPVQDESGGAAAIIAWDGDVRRAVGEYMASRFDLPWEWVDQYFDLFRVEELEVLYSPEIGECPYKAVRISLNGWSLNPEGVDKTITEALRAGRLVIPPTSTKGFYTKGQTLQEYLKANATVFANQVSQIQPLYDPAKQETLDPAIVMDRVPFPAQAHAIMAIVNLLEKQDTAICSSDMGSGKTIMALGVLNVLHRRKNKPMTALVTAPGMVVPKWCEYEIPNTIPNAKVVRIGTDDEAQKYASGKKTGRTEVVSATQYMNRVRAGYRHDGLEIVVMGIDRAKLGPQPWWGSVLWKRITDSAENDSKINAKGWHCPDCMKLLYKKVQDDKMPLTTWQDFLADEKPKDDREVFTAFGTVKPGVFPKWKQRPAIKKCPHCGAILLRPALKSRGETNKKPRWYPALALKKLRKHFDVYVADEVHQTKAQNTGRGFAFAELVKASKKVLCLTGTLVNGLSTSIKEILWRTNPKALLDEGFDAHTGTVSWASRYGVLERVTYVDEGDRGVSTKRKNYAKREPQEKPGISPELVANHLLDKTVFMELPDLGLPLVKLVEQPILVDLDERHKSAYKVFHQELRMACQDAYREGHKGAFAKFIPSTISAVDRADSGLVVDVYGREVTFPALGSSYRTTKKEQELVRIVRENLAEDRGCFIYCFYTNQYAVHHRVKRVLEDHGINAEVLESHISQEERVRWLEKQAQKGQKIIICNMRLVECGLDLLAWPTLIFFQLNYDTNTLRQASRRAWRIGQTRECRIYYLVADGTQQAAQMEVCLEKRAHAMLAEGRLDKGELAKFTRGTQMSLAADIAQCIAGEDISLRWMDLAQRDLEDVEMVEESKFRKVLAETQSRLANETLRLCGIEDEEEFDITIDVTPEESGRPSYVELLELAPKRTKRKKKKKVADGQLALFDLAVSL